MRKATRDIFLRLAEADVAHCDTEKSLAQTIERNAKEQSKCDKATAKSIEGLRRTIAKLGLALASLVKEAEDLSGRMTGQGVMLAGLVGDQNKKIEILTRNFHDAMKQAQGMAELAALPGRIVEMERKIDAMEKNLARIDGAPRSLFANHGGMSPEAAEKMIAFNDEIVKKLEVADLFSNLLDEAVGEMADRIKKLENGDGPKPDRNVATVT